MRLLGCFLVAVFLSCALASPLPLTAEAEYNASWTLEDLWELSGQFASDMIIDTEMRNGLANTRKRWPNGIIPYEISDEFTATQKQNIKNSLDKEFGKTCITIRPRQGETDYIFVTGKPDMCYSHVGRQGGKQILNLRPNVCTVHGTIVHIFMHAVGFLHQHCVTNRNKYVTIQWDNIREGWEDDFKIYPDALLGNFEPYDYKSIMHYGKNAFSKNNKPTIVPKDAKAAIGQRNGLSTIDIMKINKMYGCN